MATINSFQEIEAWQKARELTRAVYVCSNRGPFARDFGLRDQIRRAGVSAMSNIAEGIEREGTAEFIQFLAIAKGSVAEVEAQLYVALDQAYITNEEFQALQQLAISTKRLIAGFMKYLRQSGFRGSKFRPLPSRKPEAVNHEPQAVNQKPGTSNQGPRAVNREP